MLEYEWNADGFSCRARRNGDDYEFILTVGDSVRWGPVIRAVKNEFEANDVHTDVLFYTTVGHEHRVIVRKDYYVDFLLSLFRHKMLQSMRWT